ncbi:MAG: hypothetical protein GX810_09225, partial [Clostridiales bacterium]|nr:hypothetical protein [Clostridiales bacterium]
MAKDELSAYLPSTYFWGVVAGAIAPFDGGVAVLTGDNLFLRDADPAKLPATTLTVYGNYGDDAHRKAQSLMPEVPIQMRDREYFNSAQELGQALVSGENTIDVYFLDYSYIDVKNLMQKQYAYDLSESQKLMDFTKATYPLLQEASFLDGKLLAVPVDAGLGEMWMLFPDRFKETGLEEPATFFDLLDIIGRWPGELAEDFPDITPLQTESYRNQLFYSGMGLYQNLRARNREELRYDDPLFRKMLTAIDNLDTRDLDQQVNWDDMADQDEFFSRMPLIEQTGGVMLDYFQGMNSGSAKLLMLSADEGQPPAVPVMLRVAAINPRSQNNDQAIRSLENYVASLPDATKAAMMPEMNDHILSPIFEQEMAQRQATENAYKKALKTADAAAKGVME